MLLANIAQSLHSSKGRIIISIILGLGLASLFRRVCNDRNCMVFKGPSLEEVNNNKTQCCFFFQYPKWRK